MKRNNRNNLIWFIPVLILLFAPTTLPAQKKTRKQLETEKSENLKRLKDAEKILRQTESKRQNTIGQLNAINEQIKIRQELIGAIQQEVSLLEENVNENQLILDALNQDLEDLKEEYASMIFASYKASYGFNQLTFIFSAESFSQFFMRLKYLEYYGEERRNQAREIEFLSEVLNDQLEIIDQQKQEKSELLNQQIAENRSLTSNLNKQQNIVVSLGQKESEIRREIESRRKVIDNLDRMIASVIEEELRKSRLARENAIAPTPEFVRLSASFAENHSKLPWPVESGFISRGFGEQAHPILKTVKINNKGIDIQTNAEEEVRAVFDGLVAAVISVPGMNNAVLLKHGEYLTVYANLTQVHVKQGQNLKTKDSLGKVHTNADGISELHFEVWKNNQTLNPTKWLFKK